MGTDFRAVLRSQGVVACGGHHQRNGLQLWKISCQKCGQKQFAQVCLLEDLERKLIKIIC